MFNDCWRKTEELGNGVKLQWIQESSEKGFNIGIHRFYYRNILERVLP